MKYLLMIYDDEIARHTLPPDEKSAVHASYVGLVKSLGATYIGGAPLALTKTAKSVRVRDGKTQITDGPFAETREQLGGYFLVEATSYEEAAKIAERMPGAKVGTIEIRPVLDVE
jgi:hypothetical protein